VINLISRFYEINKGSILVDGINIQEMDIYELRKHIAVVLQDVFLFSGSVLDNIRLHHPDISEERVIETAKMLGAHEFIKQLPQGYHQNVYERGATLSVGQRQLISFVRAMVTNPAVLILDEATSSVDHETEETIQHAIKQMMKGRTSIVIAHRLSTIQHADEILVLDKGEIAEQGSHEKLLKQNGMYHQLYQMQFAETNSTL
jgi:ATP-binding cassette subfamily B protein